MIKLVIIDNEHMGWTNSDPWEACVRAHHPS
jgi:hypothetical protein